jgi:HD-GYP domain-containing protein (c-di-GMP phosphodiesterase class II)
MDAPLKEVPAASSLSLAEIVSALSHALDMTDGQPPGHAVRACWIGMHLGKALALPETELSDLYFTLLLKDLGCSSNAARICELFVTSDHDFKRNAAVIDNSLGQVLRFVVANTAVKSGLAGRLRGIINLARASGTITRDIVATRCVRGADIARQLRFSASVQQGILDLDEHWDGGGQPMGKAGDAISLPARIALLAQVIDVFNSTSGPDSALGEIKRRAGTWFDPGLVELFDGIAKDPEFWEALADPDIAHRVHALEPANLVRSVDDDYLDDIADGFAQVVDAKSPFTSGHSKRVALFTDLIAEELAVPAERKRWLVRAALLHDMGKLGVSNEILDKPGKLDPEEWAIVRGHPAAGATILKLLPAFAGMAKIALEHHERLDGKGYPRQLQGDEIDIETRIVTVADTYDALTADRPYRSAMLPDDALALMRREVGTAIDPDCFAALERALGRLQRQAA